MEDVQEQPIEDAKAILRGLVLRAQDGDGKAFGILYEMNKGLIFSICMKQLENMHDAEDLLQRVFLRAFERILQLEDPDAFTGWLCSIANNMVISETRRRKDVMEHVEDWDCLQHVDGSPVQKVLRKEQVLLVQLALEKAADCFSSSRRANYHAMFVQLLRQKYFEGLSHQEIAETNNWKVATVKTRLHRARAFVLPFLKKIEITD